jgi:hypothetical protein
LRTGEREKAVRKIEVKVGERLAEGAKTPPSPPPGREGEVEALAVQAGGLDDRIDALARRMTEKAQRFAEAVAGGSTKAAAARAAGFSSKGGAPWRVLDRPEVAELVRLLQERARRDARVTLESQILRIQRLGRDAESSGDLGAALRAEEMVNRLANLYPDSKVRVQHELIDSRSFTPEEFELAARLVHEARPKLLGPVIEAHFEPAIVPDDHETPLPQSKAGDCVSQDRRKEGANHAP